VWLIKTNNMSEEYQIYDSKYRFTKEQIPNDLKRYILNCGIESIVFIDRKDPENHKIRSGIHIIDSDIQLVYGDSIFGRPHLGFDYKIFINRLYGKDYKKVKDKCNSVLKELDTIQSVIGEQPILKKVKKSIENYHKELINFIQDHFTPIELEDDKNKI
jgi:hypothetical protein